MIKVGDIVKYKCLDNRVFRVDKASNISAITFEVSTGFKEAFFINNLVKLNKYSIGDTIGKYNIQAVDYNDGIEYGCFDTVENMDCVLRQDELEYYEQKSKELEEYGITLDGNRKTRNGTIRIPLKDIGIYAVPHIKKVIFSDPATIVIWEDDTKTIVKAGKNDKGKQEKYDPEKGLAMAICKKLFGTNKSGSNYYEVFKKWLEE